MSRSSTKRKYTVAAFPRGKTMLIVTPQADYSFDRKLQRQINWPNRVIGAQAIAPQAGG
jgi:hypothetical protein